VSGDVQRKMTPLREQRDAFEPDLGESGDSKVPIEFADLLAIPAAIEDPQSGFIHARAEPRRRPSKLVRWPNILYCSIVSSSDDVLSRFRPESEPLERPMTPGRVHNR
jgi:hypothetical protein